VLVRKIWKFARRIRMMREGGRVGETLDRVGPESFLDSGRPDLSKREGSALFTPTLRGRGLRRQEWHLTPGPDPRP
jgi:dissimilatory sulfite reductase (desulfoviridin) alpha/beta subunit